MVAEAEQQQGQRKQRRALRKRVRRPLALKQPADGGTGEPHRNHHDREARKDGRVRQADLRPHPRPQNGQHVETRAPADDLAKGEAGDQAQTGRET